MINERTEPYSGNRPYIYLSCNGSNQEEVSKLLAFFAYKGVRCWFDNGMNPGSERDEVLGKKIENCGYFIAIISQEYLSSIDCTDELNYARDLNKNFLMIYLEDLPLPAGMNLRFLKTQSIKKYELSDEELFNAIITMECMPKFYGLEDEKLAKKAEHIFAKLSELYPEHKIFSLDSIYQEARETLSSLYKEAGLSNVDELLRMYGYELIGGEEVKKIRSMVLYAPGDEPAVIKERIESILKRLEEYYPDHVISSAIANNHSKLAEHISGMYQWLGYASIGDMLESYGYRYLVVNGRKKTDFETVVNRIREKYQIKKARNVVGIITEYPEFKGVISTLQNNSRALYGKSLSEYFTEIGILENRAKTEPTAGKTLQQLELRDNLRRLADNAQIPTEITDDAIASIEGVVLKKNKFGQISIKASDLCVGRIIIPYGVNFVGNDAFSGQTEITEVEIPSTVSVIKSGAFSGCEQLNRLIFSEGLEEIEEAAFSGCACVEEISFPVSLKKIGYGAFENCIALKNAKFKNPLTSIREDAFSGCIFSAEQMISESDSSANDFEYTVDKKNNAKLTAYIGSSSVVSIPAAIAGHPVVSIEKGAFTGNITITELYMNDGITAIQGDAFKDCVNLKTVRLSNAVSKFTSTAFSGCRSLREINIPDSFSEVKSGLFKDSPIETLQIGKGVSSVSANAFYKGETDPLTGKQLKGRAIKEICVDPDNPYLSSDDSCIFSADGKTLLAALADVTEYEIPYGVETIADSAFDSFSNLTKVSFPATVRKIGEKAFASTGIKEAVLQEVVEVGPMAFSFCRQLLSVSFSEKLKVIADQAFEGCPIEDINLPASLRELGGNAFMILSLYQGNMKQKFHISFDNPVLSADGIAIYSTGEEGKKLMKAYGYELHRSPEEEKPFVQYEVEAGTTAIQQMAFARCNNLKNITFPPEIREIGDRAFWDCTALDKPDLPEKAVTHPLAFAGTGF